MAFHLFDTIPAPWNSVTRLGWMGVDLFFVLSGYLIGAQLLKPYASGQNSGLWTFYRKRFYRVLPAYSVVLALYFLVPWWREELGISPLWQFVTFTENLFIDYRINHAFSHAWSLCIEEHFYLLLPLIVLGMMKRPALWKTVTLLALVVAFGIGMRAFVLVHELRPAALAGKNFGLLYMECMYYPTYTRLDGLVAGVALALAKVFRPRWWTSAMQHGHSLTIAALAILSLAIWLLQERADSVYGRTAAGMVFGYPTLALGFGLLVASALSENAFLSRYRVPGAKTIAILAYSLYLTHKEVFAIAGRLLPALEDAGGVRWLLILACSSLAVASVLYFAVERPFLLLRDRRLPLQKSHPETVAEAEPAI